jgi:hypothetical protein
LRHQKNNLTQNNFLLCIRVSLSDFLPTILLPKLRTNVHFSTNTPLMLLARGLVAGPRRAEHLFAEYMVVELLPLRLGELARVLGLPFHLQSVHLSAVPSNVLDLISTQWTIIGI